MRVSRSVCQECGASYEGFAEYCNACGSERFDREHVPVPESPPLRADPTVLVVQGALWLLAVVWLLGGRSARDPIDLILAWLTACAAGLVAGLVTRNVRAAAVFAGLGAGFFIARALLPG